MTEVQSQTVIDAVQKLVKERFGGKYEAAFRFYDTGNRGMLGPKDIGRLLEDADIGNWLTRGTWAAGIIAALDTGHDGTVSFEELENAITSSGRR